MNKLKLNLEGGMPLNSNDLRFSQEAFTLAISDILKNMLGNQLAVILHGCELNPTATGYSISEGAIFYNNEVWHVFAHSISAPNPLPVEPFWIFTNAPGPEGSKTFLNGEVHNVHEVRTARLALNASLDYQVASIPASLVIRSEHIHSESIQLAPITSSGVQELPGRVKLSSVSRYRNLIEVAIGYSCSVYNNSPLHIATLPSGFRPLNYFEKLINVVIPSQLPNPNTIFLCKIQTDGKIIIQRVESASTGVSGAMINTSIMFFNA